MNLKRSLFLPMVLLITAPALADCCDTGSSCGSGGVSVANYIAFRDQSRNKVIEDVNSLQYTHLYDQDSWYGMFAITPEYVQNFRQKRITNCLFGPALSGSSNGLGCTTGCEEECLLIQGSAVTNRSSNALLADYFYLAPDYNGTVCFKPKMKTFNLTFDFYLGLDEWLCGAYVRLYGPYTHAKWQLNPCEDPITTGTLGFAAGQFTAGVLPHTSLLESFLDYASGVAPEATTGELTGFTPAITGPSTTFDPLQFAQISRCHETKNGFAGLRFEVGWDFWTCEDYFLSVNIQGCAPTGTRVRSENLFRPVIGNGHHWELGGGVIGKYCFWRSENEDMEFTFLLDANITHLFKAKEQRTFDLKGAPLSRYALVAKFTTPVEDGLLGGGTAPAAQFANEVGPLANISTRDVKVSYGVQADIVAQFTLSWCNWVWDFGYNFWARSCDKISCSSSCGDCGSTGPIPANTWALKGTAPEYGFAATASTPVVVNQAVPLSNTSSTATAFGGGIVTTSSSLGTDNPTPATAGTAGAALLDTAPGSGTQATTSNPPVFLTEDDLAYGPGTRGLSNKVYTALSYNWEGDCWSPFIGIGGSAEFGSSSHNDCNNGTVINTTSVTSTDCSNCLHCAVSQWDVFVKMGVAFN